MISPIAHKTFFSSRFFPHGSFSLDFSDSGGSPSRACGAPACGTSEPLAPFLSGGSSGRAEGIEEHLTDTCPHAIRLRWLFVLRQALDGLKVSSRASPSAPCSSAAAPVDGLADCHLLSGVRVLASTRKHAEERELPAPSVGAAAYSRLGIGRGGMWLFEADKCDAAVDEATWLPWTRVARWGVGGGAGRGVGCRGVGGNAPLKDEIEMQVKGDAGEYRLRFRTPSAPMVALLLGYHCPQTVLV